MYQKLFAIYVDLIYVRNRIYSVTAAQELIRIINFDLGQ